MQEVVDNFLRQLQIYDTTLYMWESYKAITYKPVSGQDHWCVCKIVEKTSFGQRDFYSSDQFSIFHHTVHEPSQYLYKLIA